ncbi:MAG: 5'/3'-nucleotidase SurE [Candidatus Aminicenantes bacterium]
MKSKRPRHCYLFLGCLVVFWGGMVLSGGHDQEKSWPQRVLITNDNGIEDVKIVELARAFSEIAETYVVAPLEDRSGSTHYLTVTQRGSFRVERRQIGKGIHAYAVDGFPADCVVLALTGIMKDSPPDLVISGINGGPNLGKDWLFSGTIGAARVASFAGFPAIAVSGLDDDMIDAMSAVNSWVVRLAQTPLVRELKPQHYLTASIPRVSPKQIKGVRVAKRADLLERPVFAKATADDLESDEEVWRIAGTEKLDYSLPGDCDIALYNQGYIVVVPMLCDEHDHHLLSRLNEDRGALPEWALLEEKKCP